MLLTLLAVLGVVTPGRAQSLTLVTDPPHLGTYYSLTHLFLTNAPPWPPLPMLPFDVPVYLLSNDPTNGPVYAFDDSSVDYDALDSMTAMTAMAPLNASPDSPGPLYSTNDFYLSILLDTNNPGYVDLVLHNASSPTTFYQILTNISITKPLSWYFGQIAPGDSSSNNLWFSILPYLVASGAPTNQFFRAVSGSEVVSVNIYPYFNPIIEPSSTNQTTQPGWFVISVYPINANDVTVVYNLSGSAVNGVDYTNIPTSITIPAGQQNANVYIQAKYDPKIDFDESCVLSLVLTNGYLVEPSAPSATLTISDNLTNMIQAVLTNLPVADLDYYSPSNSLIASAYYPYWNGGTNYFARIWTYFTTNSGTVATNVAITNWSYAGGSQDEVRLTVVKTNSNSVFHPGETFFAPNTNGTIGWISADGLNFSNAWLTITNELNPFADIYVDQTGIWGGDLLVVSGQSGGIPNENIWRINTNKQTTLVASIPTSHLEGLVTLPNNPTQYGPWAGKLLTADENEGLFYAVDTNGNYQSFGLDVGGDPIQPSAMKVIAAGQNLYFSDPRSQVDPSVYPPLVLKIPQQYFTNSIGDILVTRAGENGRDAALFIVHWDNATGTFINRKIPYGGGGAPFYGEYIEHATFAPLDLPPVSPQ
ncbi:MAG TPA: hypothetical protein VG146_04095 [Verrucomicrobiae bacterium]|nr:hypothetical protein [Verrucomicrobiae bacterium]